MTAAARPKDMSADLDYEDAAIEPAHSGTLKIIHPVITPLEDRVRKAQGQGAGHDIVETDSLTQMGETVNSTDVADFSRKECLRVVMLLIQQDIMWFGKPDGDFGELSWTRPETYRAMWKEIQPLARLQFHLTTNFWAPLVTALKDAEAKATNMQAALWELYDGITRKPYRLPPLAHVDEDSEQTDSIEPPPPPMTTSEISAAAKSIIKTFIVKGSTESVTQALASFNAKTQAAANQAYIIPMMQAHFKEAPLPPDSKVVRLDKWKDGVTPKVLLDALLAQAKAFPDGTLRGLAELCTEDGDDYKVEKDGPWTAPYVKDLVDAKQLMAGAAWVAVPGGRDW
eukprot:CAMPEP_0178396692 /NCGR_PEP_ID=MMETSP0689_2-20121128/13858_1 /TAXON_ID=160604 /ORGANISM="Amphidinium massartii, Strain CS-259" /LENGTH=340 /DNA_ID=CAMNT_0020017371 /DNA_START=184 /DNA_END=1206 /DNA_ORIENTATION=+